MHAYIGRHWQKSSLATQYRDNDRTNTTMMIRQAGVVERVVVKTPRAPDVGGDWPAYRFGVDDYIQE